MYEIVRTTKQQKLFEFTWEYFCFKYGWLNDPYAKTGIRYNLLHRKIVIKGQPKVIGTVEFIPYFHNNPETTVEGPGKFEFFKLEEIKSNPGRVWEIDKLCIHKDHQKQGYLNVFMHVFHDHALKHQPKYYIALIEKKFFRALRISYGLAVEQKGEPIIGPGTSLIPVMFDIDKIMQDKGEVRNKLRLVELLNKHQRTRRHLFIYLNPFLKKILDKISFQLQIT